MCIYRRLVNNEGSIPVFLSLSPIEAKSTIQSVPGTITTSAIKKCHELLPACDNYRNCQSRCSTLVYMAMSVLLVGQSTNWSWLKHLINFWMDWHNCLCGHSWCPEDEASWLTWSPDSLLAPPWGWHVWSLMKYLNNYWMHCIEMRCCFMVFLNLSLVFMFLIFFNFMVNWLLGSLKRIKSFVWF